MICKNCGNKSDFLVMVTDYKPLELWTFKDGLLTRYTKKEDEAGYLEIKIQCTQCGSEAIDREGFDFNNYSERPLIVLSEQEWEEKEKNFKRTSVLDEIDENETAEETEVTDEAKETEKKSEPEQEEKKE